MCSSTHDYGFLAMKFPTLCNFTVSGDQYSINAGKNVVWVISSLDLYLKWHRVILSIHLDTRKLHPGNLIIASDNAQLLMYKVHLAVNFETMSRLNKIILQNFSHDTFSYLAGFVI